MVIATVTKAGTKDPTVVGCMEVEEVITMEGVITVEGAAAVGAIMVMVGGSFHHCQISKFIIEIWAEIWHVLLTHFPIRNL